MDPGVFPPGLPVFTGHYHRPHTVKGTAITYIGSPYQARACPHLQTDSGPQTFLRKSENTEKCRDLCAGGSQLSRALQLAQQLNCVAASASCTSSQVSAAEAGEQKRLVVLDDAWRMVRHPPTRCVDS